MGGIARFQTVVNHYRSGEKFKGEPELVTLFSGDAFNPSLESSVTKGKRPSCLSRKGANLIGSRETKELMKLDRQSYGTHFEQYRNRCCLRWCEYYTPCEAVAVAEL